MEKSSIHKSVLMDEALKALNLRKGAVVVDATLGGGGHSLEILKKILPGGKLVAFDRDAEAIERFKRKIAGIEPKIKEEDLVLVKGNFADIGERLKFFEIFDADAILADFGLSSDQLDCLKRGFSFQNKGAYLDMRMDIGQALTAEKIVNEYSVENLERILREFGDERFASLIASGIGEFRLKCQIRKVGDLLLAIERSVPAKYRRGKIHFATRTFQALRMEVNQELASIEKFLRSAVECLKIGGRLAVISFHSGEDRLVKNIFREQEARLVPISDTDLQRLQRSFVEGLEKSEAGKETEKKIMAGLRGQGEARGCLRIITKRPVVPTDEEIIGNFRSRSAKMRVAEKVKN